ncbi:helix-turn-helix domain-containing protein [Aquamicrobium zhengzhouense]|uniref:Helix-turn-helix domain-containing protein n=1 Tax=Aquamicrobium zhengzhouense TaxID=2781738 RepID=A0ABS0SFT8_9HYPH|nr:S24 family peptidase [Aquamicrobium zhengzhouense]MBI1621475.1 helix-turn-helix domain-containing protein [Aquamicrobium zhengzhouense]
MKNTPHERLQIAREKAGFRSAADAAQNFGWGYSTYASHENGSRGLRLDSARKYARAFGTTPGWLLTGSDKEAEDPRLVPSIPVIGKVAAGVWLEVDGNVAEDDYPVIPAAPSADYPPDKQIAVEVNGPSMNKILPDGVYAIGVPLEHARSPRNGDVVALRRMRAGLVETTIKRYLERGGDILLMPESDDPRYQTPINMHAPECDTQVEVFALIIGSYRPI